MIVFAGACGDDKPTGNTDMGAKDVPQQFDAPTNDITVDLPQSQDVWPDVNPDVWPQNDTYSGGAPFGCLNDSDCFGQKCCATPWGVRLCAASCGP